MIKKMYTITDYSYKKAEQIGVIIKPSEKKNKKIDVYNLNGDYITSVGQAGMADYPTYIESHGLEYANERRRLFYKRFGTNITKGSNLYYSAKLLW